MKKPDEPTQDEMVKANAEARKLKEEMNGWDDDRKQVAMDADKFKRQLEEDGKVNFDEDNKPKGKTWDI